MRGSLRLRSRLNMAGRIIANTIVAGYPEPGVTADEIVGLVNKYGLGLSGYGGTSSKTYKKSGTIVLANTFPLAGPSYAEDSLTLEAWPVKSNVLMSVAVSSPALALSNPRQNADGNTYATVIAAIGGEQSVASGSIGQSVINGANAVAYHANYECFRIGTIPPGVSVRALGRFEIDGGAIIYEVDDTFVPVIIRINVLRVTG